MIVYKLKLILMKTKNILLLLLLVCPGKALFAQNDKVYMALLGDKFPDFTLSTIQGSEFSVRKLQGKTLLLIAPRGKYTDTKWCSLCNYQYAEYEDLEKKEDIRAKYNLEIAFIMPFSKDSILLWEKDFQGEMEKVEGWKHPADSANLSDGQKNWMEFATTHYPKVFSYKNAPPTFTLPVLIDDRQEVSKGLDLLRYDWNGSKTKQNIPTIFIVDKNGILRFKYISQSTIDRPSAEYILYFIKKMYDN